MQTQAEVNNLTTHAAREILSRTDGGNRGTRAGCESPLDTSEHAEICPNPSCLAAPGVMLLVLHHHGFLGIQEVCTSPGALQET